MKKIKYILFCLMLLMFGIINVNAANEVDEIKINITLNSDGSAHIVEVWKTDFDNGTEGYKVINNLGNMEISNFSVYDDTEAIYTYLDNWDINASFNEKIHKNGINYTSSGVELCWGMSYYGNHTYTLSYDMSNVIFNVSDAQVMYLKMIGDMAVKNFWITISGPETYSDTLDVWGYGYKGYAYVKDGKIEMTNEENRNLSKSEYVVALIEFPLGTFTSTNIITEYDSFNEVLEAAEVGTFEHDYSDNNIGNIITRIFSWLIFMAIVLFPVFGAILANKLNKKYKFETKGNGKISMKEINNFRDIPCNKNIYNAFSISQIYNLNDKNNDFIGALFLKWLFEDKIQLKKEEKGIIKKEETSIILKNDLEFSNDSEKTMYEYLISASNDNILESKELERWSKTNYNKLYTWLDNAEVEGLDSYIQSGMIVRNGSKYLVKDILKEEGNKLAGLKKFLMEFSRISEKEAIEVKLWKEYLMFAQIFGIADEVSKQFKKLYPEVVSEMNSSSFDMTDVILISHLSHMATASAATARSAARAAASSYSGGGGGFSSGGGGGGSFGGGGGGGR